MTALDDAAERLYGVPLGSFVAERKAAAAEARTAGDRDAATAIAALSKPSTAAWAVNSLARSDDDMIASLVSVGDSLRAAQDELDPDALRSLGEQRRRLVARVAARAVALAEERGQRIGPSIRDEIEQTLQAVLADAPAAAAVRTGRLVRALSTNGFDPVDLDGAVAGAPAAASEAERGGRASGTRGKGAKGAADEVAAARRRKQELEERKRALDEATSNLDAAHEQAGRARNDRQAAEGRHADLLDERDRLRSLLDRVEEQLVSTSSAADAAKATEREAEEAIAEADAVRSRAAAAFAALRSRSS